MLFTIINKFFSRVYSMKKFLRKKKDSYGYYSIAAAPGTHEAVIDSVKKYCCNDFTILELAAYQGALLQRLIDNGYTKLVAADLDNHLKIEKIKHIKCDFNFPFIERFEGKKFDCIVACEVIEHLNDPRFFLEQCNHILNDNGIIILSTPNIGFFEGRIKFFLKGELWGFGSSNYLVQRHISAISLEQFPLMLNETGYAVKDIYTAASFATPLRWFLTSFIWLPMRLFFGPSVLGETTICIGKKDSSINISYKSDDLWKKHDPKK